MRFFLYGSAVTFTFLCAFPLPVNAEEGILSNSLDMRLVRVEPGTFLMGSDDGDYDEMPMHEVEISRPFYLGVTPVTNAQFERFSPEHRALRGKEGLSSEDDEAVLFVSWSEAADFCDWLSEKEGRPYRLPTEAEWEFACRAGTSSDFSTGNTLDPACCRNQTDLREPRPISLSVGKTPPNPWGLTDMHGLVEEWCLDWYGPYPVTRQTDPIGCADGISKVTRGGSHSVEPRFLRSANRSGALPDDKNWLIGFRVVLAPVPPSLPTPGQETELWARDVTQETWNWPVTHPLETPYFEGPIPFVNIPEGANGPLFSKHNHCPDITGLPNGDMLATWYTTIQEPGRELAVAAARMRRGNNFWDAASLYLKVPDRNMHATALWWDEPRGILYHYQGVSVSYGWSSLALFFRTSTDNGVTWSKHRWINTEHTLRNMPIAGAFQTRQGILVLPCDAVTGMEGGSTIHISPDNGATWKEPGAGTPPPCFEQGKSGGTIAGIHAGVVELSNGNLMALGRGNNFGGHMPKSESGDMGRSWTYSASPFPPIGGGQRLVLMRLLEGPLLFVSFTDPQGVTPKGLMFAGKDQREFTGYGLFAALSHDEGMTWPTRKLITPGSGAFPAGGNTGPFTATPNQAEPGGYLAATQTPDHVIHLISSRLHYRFNLAWLNTPG